MPGFGMLAYEAYFDALTQCKTTTDEWKSVLAGLVVLRLIDDWLDCGMHTITKNPSYVQAVREAVARVPAWDTARPILCELVDMVTQSDQMAFRLVAPSVFDYGQTLYAIGQWGLARDVFCRLMKQAEAARDRGTTARATRQLGYVLQHLGQCDDLASTAPGPADLATPKKGVARRHRVYLPDDAPAEIRL